MKYQRILSYVSSQLWAITPEKWGEILSVLAFKAAGGEFTEAEIQARIGDGNAPARSVSSGGIAVIPLRGTIANRMSGMDDSSGGASVDAFRAMFRQAMSNDAVGAIVVDVDSPGGTVSGIPEMAAEILASRGAKPIVAQVNAMCASAAYWLMAAADEIVATPSASVGSVGVFTVREDVSAALEKEGVKIEVISAGDFKTESMPFFPLTADGRAVLQARVDEAYGQFTWAVAKGRGVSVSDVRKGYGQGRAISAKEALAAGMIDRLGTMDDTLARLSSGRRSKSMMRALTVTDMTADVAAIPLVDTTADAAAITMAQAEGNERARHFRLL